MTYVFASFDAHRQNERVCFSPLGPEAVLSLILSSKPSASSYTMSMPEIPKLLTVPMWLQSMYSGTPVLPFPFFVFVRFCGTPHSLTLYSNCHPLPAPRRSTSVTWCPQRIFERCCWNLY